MMHYKFFLALVLFYCSPLFSEAKALPDKLQVEYSATPLGIDVEKPRFSWQMKAPDGKRGYEQTAYRVVVSGQDGPVSWDSDRIAGSKSLNIQYAGTPLQPSTRYTWTVTVWDQDGNPSSASSWFETGLMNPDPGLSAWNGAKWIGGGDGDLVFCPDYLPVFKFRYTVRLDQASNTNCAGFLFGANDSRLMDRNKNLYGIESRKDGSYIRLDFNILQIDGSQEGQGSLDIYRVGYHPDDQAEKPFKSLPIPLALVNDDNKYETHEIYTELVFGIMRLYVDQLDKQHLIGSVNINPVGEGGDFICFPMLADIGFCMDPGQKAGFSDFAVMNNRHPFTTLYSEDVSGKSSYHGVFSKFVKKSSSGLSIQGNSLIADGGLDGCLIVAELPGKSMPMLRTSFVSDSREIVKARLYATSRGIYEVYVNGERVGDGCFNPGLTQYQKTHLYQTYDVTDKLRPGKNSIGALLGEGWWSGNITYSGDNWNYFGDRQSFLAKMVITYADGSVSTVVTSPETWTYYGDGPILYGSFFQGEIYDATREDATWNWNLPDFDDRKWKKAVEVPLAGTTYAKNIQQTTSDGQAISEWNDLKILGQSGETAGIVKVLTAIGVEEVRPGVFNYDMGQNMVGVPEISIRSGKRGNRITMRYAEVKYPDLPAYQDNTGMIMLENIRAALSQDIYILKGGAEIIRPRFTFHGYRFIEITGITEALPVESVKGLVISSVNELASGFECSEPKLNKLWENITWSTRGNFLSIPTDCPQRNERMGWSGDISVFARTASYLFNVPQFLRRHMLAFRDDQRADGRFGDVAPLKSGFGGTLWGSAGITVAWESWQQYGDREMLTEHYPAMLKYAAFLQTRIDPATGALNEGPLGDWLSPEGNKNDNTLLWDAYYVFDLDIMVKVAEILNKPSDAADFRKQYETRKKFFNNTYVDRVTGKTIKLKSPENGQGSSPKLVDTQGSYAIPLALGVFSEGNIGRATANLVAAVQRPNTDDEGIVRPPYSLMTGFIGTAWISKALTDHGHPETAWRLLRQTAYPSWLYPVEQGATTIWERLNSYTVENGFGGNNSMNSFNHYSFGAVGAWLYNYSLGIQRDEAEPGFKHFVLKPVPDPDGVITYAKGYYDSMYGRIEAGWRLEKGMLYYSVTVPANTSATLFLPVEPNLPVTESGREISGSEGVKFIRNENNRAIFDLKSGHYEFSTVSLIN